MKYLYIQIFCEISQGADVPQTPLLLRCSFNSQFKQKQTQIKTNMRAKATSQESKIISEAAQAAINERNEQIIQMLNKYYNKNKDREKQPIGGPEAKKRTYQKKRALIQQEAENTLVGKALFVTMKEVPVLTLEEKITEA